MRYAWLAGVLLVVGGCKVAPPPDPNDPSEVGVVAPEVLDRAVKWAWDAASARVETGEISEAQAQAYTRKRADDLVSHVQVGKVPDEQAFAYGQVFRTAQRWKEAEILFRRALAVAKNDDARVNSSLRLAQALAHLRRVDEAIQVARGVFGVPDQETAPILPAVLYEIVPAAQNQNKDKELADLLVAAIRQHERTIVNENTEAGKAFFMAKPAHIARAWRAAAALYRRAGRDDLAGQATQRRLGAAQKEIRV
ncbi:MAG: hypothetical protein KIS66_00165 [Fimbriimonadaceae bacterium]|nr:hypothetical protein [Fimbriimonadaceae bacterium]